MDPLNLLEYMGKKIVKLKKDFLKIFNFSQQARKGPPVSNKSLL